MFDVGFPELVLIFVIGLLVLGPQRLPKVAAEIGKWVGRARRTATQLRRQLEREIELSELERPSPPPPSGNTIRPAAAGEDPAAKHDESAAAPPPASPSPESPPVGEPPSADSASTGEPPAPESPEKVDARRVASGGSVEREALRTSDHPQN
jgi:sec-independent protein translocase protein TatB